MTIEIFKGDTLPTFSLIECQLETGENKITILETGTARGFSSLCMSKAINDRKFMGKIIIEKF